MTYWMQNAAVALLLFLIVAAGRWTVQRWQHRNDTKVEWSSLTATYSPEEHLLRLCNRDVCYLFRVKE